MTIQSSKKRVVTVRELGGEIFAEFVWAPDLAVNPDGTVLGGLLAASWLADVVIGILARHDGVVLENDKDFPVVPMPRRFPCEEGDDT